jgi:hypothetical protein
VSDSRSKGNGELDQLVAELQDVNGEFWTAFGSHTMSWQLVIGRFRIHRILGSGDWALMYLGFCLVCLSAGAVLTFVEGAKELGIALVVGAVFAFGSLATQAWAIQMQKEQDADSQTFGRERQRYFQGLLKRRDLLIERIEKTSPGYFNRVNGPT